MQDCLIELVMKKYWKTFWKNQQLYGKISKVGEIKGYVSNAMDFNFERTAKVKKLKENCHKYSI